MNQTIRILHLEDNPADVKLVRATIESAGLTCQITHIQTREEFEKALRQEKHDLILADYFLPGYDGLSALRLKNELCPDVPLIFVSGTMGEEATVEGMIGGARDYVPKPKLYRLVPAINRALRDAENLRALQRTETSLERNQMELKAIYDNAPIMMAALNSNFEMVDANLAFAEFVGKPVAQVKGGKVGNLLGCSKSIDDPDGCGFGSQCKSCPLHLALDNTLETGISHRSIEYQTTVQRKDGPREIFLLASTALIKVAGQINLLLCFQDITDRKIAEKERDRLRVEFLHAQKMEAYGHLAGGVAHDFNNLLTVIVGNCELGLGEAIPEHPVFERLQMVLQTANRAADLTRQLLAFSRKQVLEPKIFELNWVVTESEKMLQRLVGAHVVFKTFLGPDAGCVLADPGRIGQVILNLVVNARDAMPKGGTLTISTGRQVISQGSAPANASMPPLPGAAFWDASGPIQPGTYACFSVADTGVGISGEVMAHIFEPFFTTKEPGKGTGLGLSTVFGIVKQSKGSISIQSIPGKGTEFRVLLPVADPNDIKKTSEIRTEPKTNGDETILVVDDVKDLRLVVCQFLEIKGYKVLEAASGEEALRLSKTHQGPIHILMTDASMPGMTGPKLWEAISGERPETRALFVSGYSSDEISDLGLQSYDFKFLQKPFSMAALEQKVRETLEGSPRKR